MLRGMFAAATIAVLCGGAVIAAPAQAASEEPNAELLQLIGDLVRDADPQMRALGLQQIREEARGEAATRYFAELLPKLSPESQAALLETLGDRQDPVAKPAVLAALTSSSEAVRAAGLRALGGLGGAGEVPLLAEKAAGGSPPERDAARHSLTRLRGADVNAALIAAGTGGGAGLQAELLGVLAARHAREALPLVFQQTGDPDRQVRLAALDALRLLAEESETAAVIRVLGAAPDAASRSKAEQALLVVANRGREQCTPAILEGLVQADATSRGTLLRALGRCGGDRALAAIVARLQDEDQDVRDEALRLLSNWPDPTAVPKLTQIAKQDASLRNHVLAMRGLVRLAAPEGQTSGNVQLLAELMQLARRPEEKVLVLGAAGSQASAEALKLAAAALADPALREAAALAVVQIAEQLPAAQQQPFRPALEQVQQQAREETIRQRAEKILANR